MKITLRQTDVFAAVAREGSVTRAAEALAMTQSSASQALADFEAQLGAPCFDRHGKRLILNEVGRRVLPHALSLLAQAQALEQSARPAGGPLDLRLAASSTIGNHVLPVWIGTLLAAQPDSRITLQVNNSEAVISAVRDFQVDMGFIEGTCQDPEIEATPWLVDELVVVAPVGHPLAGTAITPAALAGVGWIVRESGSGTREFVESALAAHLPRFNTRLTLGNSEAIRRAVAAGAGLSCLSRRVVAEALENGSLVELPVPFADLRRTFLLLRHRNKSWTEGMRGFLAWCAQQGD